MNKKYYSALLLASAVAFPFAVTARTAQTAATVAGPEKLLSPRCCCNHGKASLGNVGRSR